MKRGRTEKGDEGTARARPYQPRMKIRRITDKAFGPNRIFRFKRTFATTATITFNSVVAETHGAFKHQLNDLGAYTDFTGLFDRYRIVKVKALWMPRVNNQTMAGYNTAATSEVPPLVTVVDYDDATAANATTLVEYDDAKWHWGFKPFTLTYSPHTAVALYNGGFAAYGNQTKQWIDAANPDVQYYSLKWATATYSTANNATVTYSYDVFFTYFIECMNPR